MSAQEFAYDSTNERVVLVCALTLLRGLRAPGEDYDDCEQRRRASGLVRSLAPDEFLWPLHAATWRALRDLVEHSLQFDVEALLRLVGEAGFAGDDVAAYLTGVAEDSADYAYSSELLGNLNYHVGALRWDATRARVLRGAVPELVRALKDTKAGAERVAGAARAVLRAVEGGGGRKYMRGTDELRRSMDVELVARRARGNFYPLGYAAVDARLSEGAMPQRTAVLAGLSGAGKSSFACDLAYQLAQQGRRVLYCPWEMGTVSTLDVMLSQRTRIPLRDVTRGELSEEDVARLRVAKEELLDCIKFMDNPFFAHDVRLARAKSRTPNDVNQDVLEGYLAEAGCDVVIYDLWDRMLADLRPDAVTGAINRQTKLHEEYGVYGVMVVQLNLKDVEARADQRPTRKDIKGVGSFVEMVDQVWAVHREATSKNVPDDSMELLCLKQKKGASYWSTRFAWEAQCTLPSNGVEVPFWPDSGEAFDVTKVKVRRGGASREGTWPR